MFYEKKNLHADLNNTFEETYEAVLQNTTKLKWQCVEHKIKVLTHIHVHYITMQIGQNSCAKNQEVKNMNKTKKKFQN